MSPFGWIYALTGILRPSLEEDRDALLTETPCGEPEACASYWRDVAMAAQEDADRFALQLVRLGARPEPRRDGHEVGSVQA